VSNFFVLHEPDERLSSRVWNGEDVGQQSVVGHPGQKGHLFLSTVLSVLSSPHGAVQQTLLQLASLQKGTRKAPKQAFIPIEEDSAVQDKQLKFVNIQHAADRLLL
jgi:hypothetical protein